MYKLTLRLNAAVGLIVIRIRIIVEDVEKGRASEATPLQNPKHAFPDVCADSGARGLSRREGWGGVVRC